MDTIKLEVFLGYSIYKIPYKRELRDIFNRRTPWRIFIIVYILRV